MEKSKDCYVHIDVLLRRKRKTKKKKEENIRRRRISFFLRRRKTEKGGNIWRRSLQKLSRILRRLSLETFANFWRVSVSVSENLVSKKKSRFWFWKIWSWGKKSRFLFQKICSWEKSTGFDFRTFGLRKKVSVSENLVTEKKFLYQFWSKFWYRHSVLISVS